MRERWPDTLVIVMTAFASVDTAIRAIHAGAYDYLSKPYEVEDLRLTVRRALEQSRLMRENLELRQNIVEEKDQGIEMIGMSPQMIEVYKMIARVSPTGATVLMKAKAEAGRNWSHAPSMPIVNAPRFRSSRSIAERFPRPCWKPKCSDM